MQQAERLPWLDFRQTGKKLLSDSVKKVTRVHDAFIVCNTRGDAITGDVHLNSGDKVKEEIIPAQLKINPSEVILQFYPTATKVVIPQYMTADIARGEVHIDKLPKSIAEIVRVRARRGHTSLDRVNIAYDLSQEEVVNMPAKFPSQTICGGKYLLSDSPSDCFYAIQVLDNNGNKLPPNQWRFIDWRSTKTGFPEDLERYALFSYKDKDRHGFQSVNAQTDMYVSVDSGLHLYPAGEAPIYDNDTTIDFPDITGPINKIAIDSHNPATIYYLKNGDLGSLIKVIFDNASQSWKQVEVAIPSQQFYSVDRLLIDPTGSVLIVGSGKNVHFLTSDTLQQVGMIKDLGDVAVSPTGEITGVREQKRLLRKQYDKYLVSYQFDFSTFATRRAQQKLEKVSAALKDKDYFEKPESKPNAQQAPSAEQNVDRIRPILRQVEPAFSKKTNEVIQSGDHSRLDELQRGLEQLETDLKLHMPEPEQVREIDSVITFLTTKYFDFAKRKMYYDDVQKKYTQLQKLLSQPVTFALMQTIQEQYAQLEALKPHVQETVRDFISEVGRDLNKKTSDFLVQFGREFSHQAEGLVEDSETALKLITEYEKFNDWLEFTLPAKMSALGMLQQNCPPEAGQAMKAIFSARDKLSQLATQYEKKFKQEYAAVRQQAAEQIGEMVRLIQTDIARFKDRVIDKSFKMRDDAEQYVKHNESYKQILEQIDFLELKDPVRAEDVRNNLDIQLSNLYFAIDQKQYVERSTTGQQYVRFGETLFPVWEGEVKERGEAKAQVLFQEDKATRGPGVGAKDVFGDVVIKFTDPEGTELTVPVYQVTDADNRAGLHHYRGSEISATYVQAKDYGKIKQAYEAWKNGLLKSEYQQKHKKALQEIRSLNEKKPKRKDFDQTTAGKQEWKRAYDQWLGQNKPQIDKLLKDFGEFSTSNYISILQRIDYLTDTTEVVNGNGKGYIPEWQNHWVRDAQTDQYLEEMARFLNMQSRLKEGLLLLKGHAGTGKDVLVKMFCEQARRPYFSIDCTKWTTEFELSEDIQIEAEGGASKTLKVPSVVMNAITTPGAVMYFNEINAMPEQAQIFLHSLLDEKRVLTLKTSSGKTIKADPSVLFMGSMNPGYPGTFNPQIATRSRTYSLEIDYPPLEVAAQPSDPNKHPVKDASEALRIARSVKSLTAMTREMDMTRNKFIKAWDTEINSMRVVDTPNLTGEQQFDLNVVFALVDFSAKLREHFIATFENQPKIKSGAARINVTQPISLREMRRCADELSEMSVEEKQQRDADSVAKDLITRFFAPHFDSAKMLQDLRTYLYALNSKKRLK